MLFGLNSGGANVDGRPPTSSRILTSMLPPTLPARTHSWMPLIEAACGRSIRPARYWKAAPQLGCGVHVVLPLAKRDVAGRPVPAAPVSMTNDCAYAPAGTSNAKAIATPIAAHRQTQGGI